MSIKQKINKLIYGGKWHIAFRKIGSNDTFTVFETPKGEFCADPIVIESNGHNYVFCEQFKVKNKKGCIGYFSFDNGFPVNEGIIIEKDYHMSYPFVFFYAGHYYMIPETSENKTVEIYIAEEFPNKWKLLNVLLSGKNYVDTTVWIDDSVHFITYYDEEDGYYLEEYCLENDFSSCMLLKRTYYTENVARGAGAIIHRNDYAIRPSQNCKRMYGESIIFNKLDLNDSVLEETPIKELSVKDFVVNVPNVIAVHTYATIGDYEIIDVFEKKLDCSYNLGSLMAKKKRMKLLERKK